MFRGEVLWIKKGGGRQHMGGREGLKGGEQGDAEGITT